MILLIICRLALQTFICKLGKTPTKSQCLEAFKWCDRLQSQIDAFHTWVAAYWIKDVALQEEFVYNSTDGSEDSDNDNSDYSENGLVTSTLLLGPEDPERVPICLHHTLGGRPFVMGPCAPSYNWSSNFRRAKQMMHYKVSISLWAENQFSTAQAFATRNRKKGKTQSWQEIHEVASTANHFSKVYTWACDWMVCLSAPSAVMKHYQVLEKEHFNVTTIAIDPSQRGTRRH